MFKLLILWCSPRMDPVYSVRVIRISSFHGILPGRFVVAMLALALLTLPQQPALAEDEPWLDPPQFDVFNGNPYAWDTENEVPWYEFEEVWDGISEPLKQEMEQALLDAAMWYKKHDFPPPELPIVDTESGRAYRVYVCNEEWDQVFSDYLWGPDVKTDLKWKNCGISVYTGEATPASYSMDCPQLDQRRKLLVINSDAVTAEVAKVNQYGDIEDVTILTEFGYQTLAHELMHAVFEETGYGLSDQKCKFRRNWITEGIADAAAWDIAEEWRKQGRFHTNISDAAFMKRWGYRPYAQILPQKSGPLYFPGQPDKKINGAYHSSSFWRYVVDSYPLKWKIMVSAKGDSQPGLLDLPIDGEPGGWRSEVNWLNKGLQEKFNLDLAAMYGLFVSHFANTVPPTKNWDGKADQPDVMEKWTTLLFRSCASIDLSSAPQQSVNLQIRALAARCFWVEPTDTPEAIQITFQVGSDDLGLLEDIRIGRPGTSLLTRPHPIARTPHLPTKLMASWRDWPQDGGERTLYVITNLARKPHQSKHREFTLIASLPGHKINVRGNLPARQAVPTPGQPSHEKHAKTLAKQRSDTQKMIEEQMRKDMKSLSGNLSQGTTVRRWKPEARIENCRNPFKYSACGPELRISLTVRPGTFLQLGSTNAEGGATAQFFAGGLAMARVNFLNTQAEARELEASIDALDGSEVRISMPLVEYGYTGTFDSAKITVTMRAGKKLSAFGPQDEFRRYPLAGRVTIDEYTPMIMRGSFVAPLAEIVKDTNYDPGVYERRATVTGTFTSVAPWVADERTQVVEDSEEVRFNEALNSIGLPPGIIRSILQERTTPGGTAGDGTGSGSSSGNGGESGDCTCECDMKEYADELCELLCEEEFAACDSE